MSNINKKWSYRNAKGQFVKKTVVEGVEKYYDKVKIERDKPESILQEIKNLDLKKLAKIAKKGNQDRDYDAIYKDNKKRWVSNRDIENIRQAHSRHGPAPTLADAANQLTETISRTAERKAAVRSARSEFHAPDVRVADRADIDWRH